MEEGTFGVSYLDMGLAQGGEALSCLCSELLQLLADLLRHSLLYPAVPLPAELGLCRSALVRPKLCPRTSFPTLRTAAPESFLPRVLPRCPQDIIEGNCVGVLSDPGETGWL